MLIGMDVRGTQADIAVWRLVFLNRKLTWAFKVRWGKEDMPSPGKQKVLSNQGLLSASACPPTSVCLPTFRRKLLKWFYWLSWESQDERWITSCICETLWLHIRQHRILPCPPLLSTKATVGPDWGGGISFSLLRSAWGFLQWWQR